jgi:hypothetical protein
MAADLFISFVLGIISTLLVKIGILDRYYRPRLQIGEDVPVRTHLDDNSGNRVEFIAHRIVIRNTGRTAAKDCKAYIRISETQIQRTAWMISSNDRPYTVTLNVQDLEYADLYAVSQDRMTCVIPLEYGYSKGTISSCMFVPQNVNRVVLRISSSNATPVESTIALIGRAQDNA